MTWKLAEPSMIVLPSGFSPVEKRSLSTVWPISATRLAVGHVGAA